MEKLVKIFNEIRSCYFPCWDKKGEWKIIVKDDEIPSIRGRCIHETKTILVRPSMLEESNNELRTVICHEICHACAALYHGKIWQARYLKVASKAEDIGQLALADSIRYEVKLWQEAPKRTAHNIYCEIEDAVYDQPDCPFDLIIEWVANNNGMTPIELLKRYQKAEKVYNAAKEMNRLFDKLGPLKHNK